MHALITRATSFFFFLAAPAVLASPTETLDTAPTQQAPAQAPDLLASTTLRFMTFNIRHGVGRDGVLDLDRTADAIRTANPDVVALQEVDVYFSPRSACKDQVAELASRLGYYYYFSASLDYPGDLFLCGWANRRRYGNAILSRTPIYGGQKTSLPSFGNESRTLLSAYVSINNVTVAVHSTHLSHADEAERQAQAAAGISKFNAWGGPGVLGGDFNAEPQNWTLAPLSNQLTEAFYLRQGPGGVDLVFSDLPAANVLDIGEFDNNASDHSARWADYLIQAVY
ncbi:hypothetical protein F0U59_12175 [Archangium gephyra]|nr:hypothetical protein F0U59_12175 [Archangium gephyra]